MTKTITITERPDKKTSEILAICGAKFPVWSYYDDARLDRDFPAPKEANVRHFLKEQETDKETLGLSVREAEAKGFTNGITIRERMLLELAYFEETGQHMDIKGITFCSGSRYSGGGFVSAYWHDGRFRVGWCALDDSRSDYGVRSAVSLDSFSSIPSGLTETSTLTPLGEAIQQVKDAGYTVECAHCGAKK
jgi:hypothetical protein